MSQSEKFSDEFLNAFIDGELDDTEKDQLLDILCHDGALNARVCDLRKVRELLQHAYRQPPEPPRPQPSTGKWSRFNTGIAASVILGLGIIVGWALHEQQHPQGSLPDIAQSMQRDPAQAADRSTWRVVLHVTTADPYRLKTVLDEAEDLLRQRASSAGNVAVDILANGRGLDLLRVGTSPFAQRIHELQARYDSLAFKACQNAINRLRREKNIEVILLPEAQVVPTAIGEVIRRQREGWAYVQI